MSILDVAQLQIPKVLEEFDSPLNGTIRVLHVGKTRKIMVNNFVQSLNWDSPACSRLYWGKTLEILNEHQPDMKRMLLLGFGGGTLSHLITKKFPEVALTSVEFDPVMVEIAKKYFDADKIANHRLIVADAMKVVVDPLEFDISTASFDVLMVDIYVGENYPDLGKSGNFISAVKSLVRKGGLVIFNRIYLQHHQDEVNNFIQYVSGLLTNVQCLVVAGYTNSDNVLVFGRN
ncbi:hypothetical protein A3K34_03345 [candidate division WWE3 bacterium RIFOXYC1_FULL_40_10]|uniref:Methyltransferase domain-containing protein n=1 Tax=candidate division WWE3 bacterium RIFOXYA2_FULL_46_9 TaxID=1802636 RepID=A0A1F4VYS7_UNCKA|nr:MAG: hypothetical protein A3K58_03345 [candidate division WWE3 bacterium RIFOXYB1_FULL_40_22]OGC61883.1 MAG: hypothetical protein A3K37_03345 [candidate division WWE3 bacterium RIFOXYA1_FULL_40_11]OGC62250.1 MAG: hypothetical protein A2264_03105 [candidate division WWE3 bacterium RIFOXYA2_FULL_46_9]OGC64355.1 MAG: hypothetical protein A2326_00760 [candidate division WWE3 bacterium RIFOXYB2_FULL_41_6]OGC66266.1 MAG: hypothetical protein A3K34_03345 [candidate division WWE3 bacterium RIFOXYC1_